MAMYIVLSNVGVNAVQQLLSQQLFSASCAGVIIYKGERYTVDSLKSFKKICIITGKIENNTRTSTKK